MCSLQREVSKDPNGTTLTSTMRALCPTREVPYEGTVSRANFAVIARGSQSNHCTSRICLPRWIVNLGGEPVVLKPNNWPRGYHSGLLNFFTCVAMQQKAKKFRDDYVLVKALGLTSGAKQGQLQSKADIALTHNLGGEFASYSCAIVILGAR